MKFFNINGVKLRVTLSVEDSLRYSIDSSVSEHNGRAIRKAVRDILEVAQAECGFSADGDKILVQCYPLEGGECELLVTRLGTISRKDREAIFAAEGVSLLEKERGVYRFSSFSDLYDAVRVGAKPYRRADLYRDDLGRYYLHIDEEFADGISEHEVLIEYGERLNSLPIAVLSEYGTLLAKDNAVSYVLDGGAQV